MSTNKQSNVSLDYLLDERKRLDSLIESKRKEEALAKSGLQGALRKGEHHYIDVDLLEEVEKPADILFIKWFVEYKTNYKGIMPRYIHKVISDADDDWGSDYKDNFLETTYIFANERHSLVMSAGRIQLAVIIHDDSIPYLMDEFRDWAWDLKVREPEKVVINNEPKQPMPVSSMKKPSLSNGRVIRRGAV